MLLDIQQIETQLCQLVESIVLTRVEPDTLLIESGYVDSLAAVDIAVAVESTFGVKIPAPEIDTYLESVQTLAAYIAQQRT